MMKVKLSREGIELESTYIPQELLGPLMDCIVKSRKLRKGEVVTVELKPDPPAKGFVIGSDEWLRHIIRL